MRVSRIFCVGTGTVVTLALMLPVFLAGCVTKNRDVQVPAPVVETQRDPPPPPPRDRIIDGGPGRPLFCHIQFPFDSADILPEGKAELDEVCKAMKRGTIDDVLPEGHTGSEYYNMAYEDLLLGGHTCDEGSEDYNMALGLRRAEAVKAYLVKGGIPAERIKVKSYGETEPAVPNDGPNRALNRRVDYDFRLSSRRW